MSFAWLMLFLAGLIRLLVFYGFNLQRGASAWVLLPLVSWAVILTIRRRWPGLITANRLFIPAAIGWAALLAFASRVYLDAWDTWSLWPNLFLAAGGLGTVWVACNDEPEQITPATWLWVGFWWALGAIDPVFPLVGGGLAVVLFALGAWPRFPESTDARPPLQTSRWAWFLLGIAFSKPWWDWGNDPRAAQSGAFLGLGGALGLLPWTRRWGSRIPLPIILSLMALLFVFYLPEWRSLHGLLLGILAGWALDRGKHDNALGIGGWFFLAGLLFSFVLHANLGIPGLRSLLWFGS